MMHLLQSEGQALLHHSIKELLMQDTEWLQQNLTMYEFRVLPTKLHSNSHNNVYDE